MGEQYPSCWRCGKPAEHRTFGRWVCVACGAVWDREESGRTIIEPLFRDSFIFECTQPSCERPAVQLDVRTGGARCGEHRWAAQGGGEGSHEFRPTA